MDSLYFHSLTAYICERCTGQLGPNPGTQPNAPRHHRPNQPLAPASVPTRFRTNDRIYATPSCPSHRRSARQTRHHHQRPPPRHYHPLHRQPRLQNRPQPGQLPHRRLHHATGRHRNWRIGREGLRVRALTPTERRRGNPPQTGALPTTRFHYGFHVASTPRHTLDEKAVLDFRRFRESTPPAPHNKLLPSLTHGGSAVRGRGYWLLRTRRSLGLRCLSLLLTLLAFLRHRLRLVHDRGTENVEGLFACLALRVCERRVSGLGKARLLLHHCHEPRLLARNLFRDLNDGQPSSHPTQRIRVHVYRHHHPTAAPVLAWSIPIVVQGLAGSPRAGAGRSRHPKPSATRRPTRVQVTHAHRTNPAVEQPRRPGHAATRTMPHGRALYLCAIGLRQCGHTSPARAPASTSTL